MKQELRRLAAIVAADVVGYSRLMGSDESGTLASLKAHLRELIEPKIQEHAGRIVKTTGDGLLAEFPSVVDAVRCAVELQRGMQARNAAIPADRRLVFRIGINVGDIIIEGDDIYGDGVNVAARLETLADPGGICVSRNVRDQVVDKLDFTFEGMGPQQVKNIARPVEAFHVLDSPRIPGKAATPPRPPSPARRRIAFSVVAAIAVLGALAASWRFLKPDAYEAPALSLAVLPFAPAADTADELRAAERLTLDTIAAIERGIRPALVKSHGMTAKYKGRAVDARVAGRELAVQYLLEGDVVNDRGTRLLIARLVETSKGTQVWSERLEQPGVSGSEASRGIAGHLSSRLRPVLYRAEQKRVSQLATPRAAAIDLVLRGDEEWRKETSFKGNETARRLYEEALRKDPDSVPAMLGLSMLKQAQFYGPQADRERLLKEMDQLTSRAVAADRLDARAWRARATVLGFMWQWEGAFEANAAALRIDPFQNGALADRAFLFILAGRAEEALPVIDQAIAIDPGSPSMPNFLHVRCWALLHLERYDQAIEACERGAALGEGWMLHVRAAAAYAQKGDKPGAEAARAKAMKQQPGITIAYLKSWQASNNPVFLRQREETLFAGLRKIGIPEE